MVVYESDIEARLVTGVENLGGECIKHGQDGWPDRIVVLPGGEVVWVELKRPDGRVADIQKWRAARLRKLGQWVATPHSKDDVDDLLQGMRSCVPQ